MLRVMSGELLAAVCMLILWGACGALIIWAIRKPKRQANAALAQLNTSLRLATSDMAQSLWPASREQFRWGTWPVLQGTRNRCRCEVTVQPGVRWHSTLTWVTVSGPDDVGGRILVSRQPEMQPISGRVRKPFSRSQLRSDRADLQSFTSASIFYDRDAFERLLSTPVRAKVLELPRHWINIGFDGTAMLIAWWGVEADAAIVEQAFRIGEECLALSRERAAPERGEAGARVPGWGDLASVDSRRGRSGSV
jgi:hypothetical protein